MAQPVQSYENHRRFVTPFHRVASLLLLVVLGWNVYRLFVAFSVDRVMEILLLVAIAIVYWYTRAFPLGVQDRVIRLEERLRMERLLPDDLRPRIGDFTTDQLVALRFASDAELPELARRVLAGEFADRDAIKRAVTEWRSDHQRI